MSIEAHRPTVLTTTLLVVLFGSGLASAQGRDAVNGRTLYSNLGCETCHGKGGGGTEAGPSLTMDAPSLTDFIAYVRRPEGTMQPYGGEDVSDSGLSDIYAHLGRQASEKPPEGRVEVGATLYRKAGCYECHSNEAQGGAQGPRLGPDPISLATFNWYTRYPTGAMPPYTANVLSDQDLADIYAFVEARPEPPPLGSIPLLAPKD